MNRHRHDPYAFRTRKIDGKTVTRMHSDVELAELKPLFDNARKLRGLTSHLQELAVELVELDDTRPRTRSRRVRHWRRTRTARVRRSRAQPGSTAEVPVSS